MKILVIGCGSIGRRHARNLRDLGVKDLLVFDPEKERATQLAGECEAFSADTLEQSYGHQPEAVLICAPTSLHLSLARQALEHDCHIFLEKPLSHSMDGVTDFLAEVEARHRVLLVGYNLRFDPLLRQLHAWLNESRIGRVVSARLHFGSYLPWRHPWEDYRFGYGARRDLGGGVILDAIHELDYALWLFGHPKRVYCAGGKHSSLEIDVEDVAEILMSYENAVVSVHLDFIAQSAQRTCDIVGSQGQIHADLVARTLALFNGTTREWSAPQVHCPFDELYRLELQHFLDCIAAKTAPAVDGSTALESLLLADAAKRSITTGTPITFGRARCGAGELPELTPAPPRARMRNGERVGIVVQARMGSSRLPGKVLIPIEGTPLLRRLCNRVAQSRRADALVVATSVRPEDQAIADACRSWGIPVFRGPEKDVTTRFLGAAREHGFTTVIRVTGDNPLTDPGGIDELIAAFENRNSDLVHNGHRNGYPYGAGAELIRISALERCDKQLNNEEERENVFWFCRQHPDQFSCQKLDAPLRLLRPQYFLTVDYPEDVELLSRIYARFQRRDDVNLEDVIEYLDSNPELTQLNSNRHQPFSE